MVSILHKSVKERNRRIKYKFSESSRRYYKFLKIQSCVLGYMPLNTLPKVQTKNYCLVSGSARSIYSKKFRMSRHQVKKYFEYICGLVNSSWWHVSAISAMMVLLRTLSKQEWKLVQFLRILYVFAFLVYYANTALLKDIWINIQRFVYVKDFIVVILV